VREVALHRDAFLLLDISRLPQLNNFLAHLTLIWRNAYYVTVRFISTYRNRYMVPYIQTPWIMGSIHYDTMILWSQTGTPMRLDNWTMR